MNENENGCVHVHDSGLENQRADLGPDIHGPPAEAAPSTSTSTSSRIGRQPRTEGKEDGGTVPPGEEGLR